MTADGPPNAGYAIDDGNSPSRTLAPPIAAAPEESSTVNHPLCRDSSCLFYGPEVDESTFPRAPADARAMTDAPTSPGTSPIPSTNTPVALGLPPPTPRPPPPPSPPSPSPSYTYSPSKAVEYAKKWALAANPDYERFYEDCTNFVSQALLAGGWPMITSERVCDNPGDPLVWWYRRDACFHPFSKNTHCSRTWSVASFLFMFLNISGRATPAKRVWDLEPGDVLQKDYGDGLIKHTLLAVDKTEDNLYFASHTLDYAHEPFWGKGGIFERNPGHNWFGFRIK